MKFIKIKVGDHLRLINAATIDSIERNGDATLITRVNLPQLLVDETPEKLIERIENTDLLLLEEVRSIRNLLEASVQALMKKES